MQAQLLLTKVTTHPFLGFSTSLHLGQRMFEGGGGPRRRLQHGPFGHWSGQLAADPVKHVYGFSSSLFLLRQLSLKRKLWALLI